jgi:hypothetical protein
MTRLHDQEVRPRLVAQRLNRERHVVLLGNSTQLEVEGADGNDAPSHISYQPPEVLGSARIDP